MQTLKENDMRSDKKYLRDHDKFEKDYCNSIGERGTGRTTSQLKHAPMDAFFVWCSHYTDYPKMLAEKIGRQDLKIVSPDWLELDHWVGLKISGIVVDHAAKLNIYQMESLLNATAYIGRE